MTVRRMGCCANLDANLNNLTAESKDNTNENMSENFQGRSRHGFGMG